MSQRYALTASLATTDVDLAMAAAADMRRMIDEKCIAHSIATYRVRPTTLVKIVFSAAGQAEADDIAARTRTLPGLPPMDAVRVVTA